jgi:sec-independent protein translocase protein TatA
MGLENPLHIAILVAVVALVFGAKRLPSAGRSLGTGLREFKDGITGSGSHPGTVEAAGGPEPAERPPPPAQDSPGDLTTPAP